MQHLEFIKCNLTSFQFKIELHFDEVSGQKTIFHNNFLI